MYVRVVFVLFLIGVFFVVECIVVVAFVCLCGMSVFVYAVWVLLVCVGSVLVPLHILFEVCVCGFLLIQ